MWHRVCGAIRTHTSGAPRSWLCATRRLGGTAKRAVGAGEWVIPAIVTDGVDSFFDEMRIPVGDVAQVDANAIGTLSQLFPAKGLRFRETPGDYDFDWHQAPQRQFIVNLDAAVRVFASAEGEGSLVLPAGQVFWVEDVVGNGHRSEAVDGATRRSIFIPVADDVDMSPFLQRGIQPPKEDPSA